jgi:hypothetical protein
VLGGLFGGLQPDFERMTMEKVETAGLDAGDIVGAAATVPMGPVWIGIPAIQSSSPLRRSSSLG